jgi:GT2 family glycosyltransferase
VTSKAKPIGVVIPVFGQPQLTAALLEDVERERDLVDTFIVDNGNDYDATHDVARVIRPAANLGWAGGCNAGLEAVFAAGHELCVFLNNDTRLSPGFFRGMLDAQERTSAGLVAPVFNDVWPQHSVAHTGPAGEYRPRGVHRAVEFVDGTCMAVPRRTYLRVGVLDAAQFGRFGWGAELDYSVRVRSAGMTVCVTELSFLTHIRQATARIMCDDYGTLAGAEMDAGMREKWGADWARLLVTEARSM